ncbi:HD domain-containing protein [Denitromonas ohlonensis]|uniref:HD domain-containing protein n=1 Tax=Denitromonas ohlonensis TaxID=3078508 RepID=UPI001C8FB355|nr:HD domain-containing protein [Denitromonas ohlonensis]
MSEAGRDRLAHDALRPTEAALRAFILTRLPADPAHDISHVERVVANARLIAAAEGADLAVVIPAAWLHDCVSYPKNHPDRARSSRDAAALAVDWLREQGTSSNLLPAIGHAIEAHSFSAGITAETLEAKVVQDADRLEALGAIGIARCLMVGGALGRPLYHTDDPFCASREPDDQRFTIDHFYRKLFHVGETLHTDAAKREAAERIEFMRAFLAQLGTETAHKPEADG